MTTKYIEMIPENIVFKYQCRKCKNIEYLEGSKKYVPFICRYCGNEYGKYLGEFIKCS